ncbi:hypothetical protein ACFE04_018183 [Oxalis oulophora]
MAAKSPQESSFSFSRRYFNFGKKFDQEDSDQDDEQEILTFNTSSHFPNEKSLEELENFSFPNKTPTIIKNKSFHSKFLSSLAKHGLIKTRRPTSSGLGSKVTGTLFGYRRGHVHFAFQNNPSLSPAFLIELATPTSVLVREMASGLVRIALECERSKEIVKKDHRRRRLIDENQWRTYCNGKKCGYAVKRECGEEEWRILKALEAISMGAGVLPARSDNSVSGGGEVMYMRARFERVVGSRDSEAFYMMNPDGSGCPELSVYLLRV